MLRYIGKRLLQMIPVIIIISIVVFSIVEIMPGDPLSVYLGEDIKLTPEQADQMREALGLNRPAWQRYFSWVFNMVRGEFGRSTVHRKPVNQVIGTFVWNSFILNFVVLIIAFILSIIIGIQSAVKKGKLFDNFFTVFSLVFVSIPTFVFGIILIYVFALKLKIFPMNSMVTAGYIHDTSTFSGIMTRVGDIAYHMILPATVLVLANLAGYVRYVRSSMIEVIDEDYIRTARAKGLSQNAVIYKHAFRNALIPIVTLFGSAVGGMFSGAVMLESIFIWPGMGKVLVESVNKRDLPLMLVLFLFYALTSLIGNLIADIGYALVDPRVRLDS